MLSQYLMHVTVAAIIDAVLIIVIIPMILVKKREPSVAVAWCLTVIFLPLLGAILFWILGYNYLHRRVTRKRTHRDSFRLAHPSSRHKESTFLDLKNHPQYQLSQIANSVEAFPISAGNEIQIYHDTQDAFAMILQDIARATHHIHLEFYIVRDDAMGRELARSLIERANAGVKVRLLFDSVGSLFLANRLMRDLANSGIQVIDFLPVNPMRSWIQVNLRNHRKIVVIDGKIAFTGGMNIGDEYLGRSKFFGYWRDTFVRVVGPAVADLQWIFTEDWHFASRELLTENEYFPPPVVSGTHTVQVVESGPDQDWNSIREVYFAAILAATKRLWIASPYFVPDSGLLDALHLARLRGVDVRLLCLYSPDHFLSFYASRYYWGDLLSYGGKVWQYKRGMMHAKVVIVDETWAMVGSANLDNRSLHLNFEAGLLLYDEELINNLARQYERDLADSVPLDKWAFRQRPYLIRLLENGSRLFSPIL